MHLNGCEVHGSVTNHEMYPAPKLGLTHVSEPILFWAGQGVFPAS